MTKVMRKTICVFRDIPVKEVTDNHGAVIRECLSLCTHYSAGGEHLSLVVDSFGIISDISIPASAMEQLHIMAEFLGCYTFQIPSLSVTRLSDIVERMKSPSGIEFRTGTRGSDAFAWF